MKTMERNERSALEAQILSSIIAREDLFELFDLVGKDFLEPVHRKVFEFIAVLKSQGKEVAPVAFANDFNINEIRHVLVDNFTSPKLYLEACKALREDTLRHELTKSIEQSGDSFEHFRFVEALQQINTIETLESFEEQVRLYGEEYKAVAAKRAAGEGVGLVTSWQRFAKKVTLMPGDYCVIGARTSMGKTSFALNMAIDAAALGQKVLFISSEMPRKHIFDKIAALLAQSPVYKFKFAHEPVENVLKLLRSIAPHFRFIYLPRCTTSLIRQILRKAGPVDLVVIDYLQLLKDASLKGETENLRLGKISGALKAMAGEFNAVFVVPAQLNRDSETQKRLPVLSDLRDSGCIEQDADVVLLLHREHREAVDARLIVAKNRTGEVGVIEFLFNSDLNYFKENDEIMPGSG